MLNKIKLNFEVLIISSGHHAQMDIERSKYARYRENVQPGIRDSKLVMDSKYLLMALLQTQFREWELKSKKKRKPFRIHLIVE